MTTYFPSAVTAGDEKNALRSWFSSLSIFQIWAPSLALTQKIDPRYLSADVSTSVADAPQTRSPTTAGEDGYMVSSSGLNSQRGFNSSGLGPPSCPQRA